MWINAVQSNKKKLKETNLCNINSPSLCLLQTKQQIWAKQGLTLEIVIPKEHKNQKYVFDQNYTTLENVKDKGHDSAYLEQ